MEENLKKGLYPRVLMKRPLLILGQEFDPGCIPKMIHYECILKGENAPILPLFVTWHDFPQSRANSQKACVSTANLALNEPI